jgi:hypothetical protein
MAASTTGAAATRAGSTGFVQVLADPVAGLGLSGDLVREAAASSTTSQLPRGRTADIETRELPAGTLRQAHLLPLAAPLRAAALLAGGTAMRLPRTAMVALLAAGRPALLGPRRALALSLLIRLPVVTALPVRGISTVLRLWIATSRATLDLVPTAWLDGDAESCRDRTRRAAAPPRVWITWAAELPVVVAGSIRVGADVFADAAIARHARKRRRDSPHRHRSENRARRDPQRPSARHRLSQPTSQPVEHLTHRGPFHSSPGRTREARCGTLSHTWTHQPRTSQE